MHYRLPMILSLFAILAAVGLAPAAHAIDEPSIELYYGSDSFNSDFGDENENVYGLRGGFWLGERWGLEGSINRLDERDIDVNYVDFSARYSLIHNNRHRLFLLGGAGLFRVDVDRLIGDFSSDDFTLHVGLAYTFDLSEHFYLRPTVLGRWLDTRFDFDQYQTEVSGAIGLRF